MDKIIEIANEIRTHKDYLYIELAFQYYIDNQINENELINLLKLNNYELPSSFFSLSFREKKNYFNHIQTRIYFENNEAKMYYYEVFNKNYFSYLSSLAYKSKKYTLKLIAYVKNIGIKNVNLLFYGLQQVKISNTSLQNQLILDYIKNNKINNFYDLLISIFSTSEINNSKELKENIKSIMNRDFYFNFDLDNPYYLFCLYCECLINILPRKEANTIKYKFNILKKEYLFDDDYYLDLVHQIRIVNTFKKKTNNNLILRKLSNFIDIDYVYEKFPPNGYLSLYYFLIEENL